MGKVSSAAEKELLTVVMYTKSIVLGKKGDVKKR